MKMNPYESNFYSNSDFLRQVDEKDKKDPARTPFRRDVGRLIHCPSFRRLQGKTQLFPWFESDYFRNRLTHSIEVANICKSIGHILNKDLEDKYGIENKYLLDIDLLEFAGLAHDLGHPPFGHAGEHELASLMSKYGGFEANAQNIRILCKLEKKIIPDTKSKGDLKGSGFGLNPTFRSILATLKYDRGIDKDKKKYGYYSTETEIIIQAKNKILGKKYESEEIKSIECQIMDYADDVAYSTYDFEDALKSGLIDIADLFSKNVNFYKELAIKVNSELKKKKQKSDYSVDEIKNAIFGIFYSLFEDNKPEKDDYTNSFNYFGKVTQISNDISQNGSIRNKITSDLVGYFLKGFKIEINEENPVLSKLVFSQEHLLAIEILKQITYMTLVAPPRFQLADYRGKKLIRDIFNELLIGENYKFLPLDLLNEYKLIVDQEESDLSVSNLSNLEKEKIINNNSPKKRRIICDFIASMTDRYVLEFHGRLFSENSVTFFKPYY